MARFAFLCTFSSFSVRRLLPVFSNTTNRCSSSRSSLRHRRPLLPTSRDFVSSRKLSSSRSFLGSRRHVAYNAQNVQPLLAKLKQVEEAQQGYVPEAEFDEEYEDELVEGGVLSDPTNLYIVDKFLDHQRAKELRKVFDKKFKDPRSTSSDRFCWDYWHVENQYTHMRTPANLFFPKKVYKALEDALLEYGQKKLGCRSITPIWLSYYVDGCRQELHCDNPHGPWAFVFSLTNWDERKFTGGETMILNERVLNFWSSFQSSEIVEFPKLVDLIEPKFDRLTVFNPRFPHGVRVVEGVRDPREARIVLHGWFSDPEPFYEGALTEEAAVPTLNAALEKLFAVLEELPSAIGTMTVRLTVEPNGSVSDLEWLTDTLIADPLSGSSNDEVREAVITEIINHLASIDFPHADGITHITLPFSFESGYGPDEEEDQDADSDSDG